MLVTFLYNDHGNLCSTDTDRRISIGLIRIRGYVKFLQNLKAQRCIGVSDTDTRIRIGYVIRGHVEVSGLYSFWLTENVPFDQPIFLFMPFCQKNLDL